VSWEDVGSTFIHPTSQLISHSLSQSASQLVNHLSRQSVSQLVNHSASQ